MPSVPPSVRDAPLAPQKRNLPSPAASSGGRSASSPPSKLRKNELESPRAGVPQKERQWVDRLEAQQLDPRDYSTCGLGGGYSSSALGEDFVFVDHPSPYSPSPSSRLGRQGLTEHPVASEEQRPSMDGQGGPHRFSSADDPGPRTSLNEMDMAAKNNMSISQQVEMDAHLAAQQLGESDGSSYSNDAMDGEESSEEISDGEGPSGAMMSVAGGIRIGGGTTSQGAPGSLAGGRVMDLVATNDMSLDDALQVQLQFDEYELKGSSSANYQYAMEVGEADMEEGEERNKSSMELSTECRTFCKL